MLLHGNLCYKKSVTQKCCSSQVSTRDEYTLPAERETPNSLVVVWSGNEARRGSRNVNDAQTETERVLTRLVTAHPWPSVSRAKRVFVHAMHVLNVSHPVLSSRVARTTRRSLATRTSRILTFLLFTLLFFYFFTFLCFTFYLLPFTF